MTATMTHIPTRTTTRSVAAAAIVTAVLGFCITVPTRAAHASAATPAGGGPPSTADALEAAARLLRDSISEYPLAVHLLQQSAALRSADDPRAVESLRWAGQLAYAAFDLPDARALMEQAADRAFARGDIATAANAEIDAGLIAQEEHNVPEVRRIGAKVRSLLASPSLSEADHQSISSRVVDHTQDVAVRRGR